ncbi:hypothetical protein [Moraxella equi]|uniref:Uncharacterized protein n=1 Tax=Moraxella equi TaxID=60442 RepID=A0A378QT67_9GAMM|nr:hypothetical protein [Moraxella equi]OPH36001.1 hypothetical protein B5J93_09965 [Moraxella equi]STZ03642.1 Uncharacterised protein [Moraxella equi]
MTNEQMQLLSRAGEALRHIDLLITMAKNTQNDALRFYTVGDFVALLESPLDELSSCLCNEKLEF